MVKQVNQDSLPENLHNILKILLVCLKRFKTNDVTNHKMFTKTLLIVLIVNFVSDSYGQKSKKFFRKDYNYIEAVESFYKIHTIPQSWADAKRVCALEAATFFYAGNDNEASAVVSFWKRTKPTIMWLWVGISDILVEGLFETVDGKPISEVYTNWFQQGVPDNYGGNEDCLILDIKSKMNDYVCEKKSYFICKKSLQSLQWNYECNIPNLDYIFNKDTSKCYKLHTTPMNWTEAYAICQLEQSTLAVINNRQEADYLAKLAESTPKPRVKGKYHRGLYHLGFRNILNEGWQTVKGTPLNVDAEVWFDNYQPDGNDHEECGSMFYTGRLINTECDTRSFFICEHKQDNIHLPVSTSFSDSVLQPYVGGGVE